MIKLYFFLPLIIVIYIWPPLNKNENTNDDDITFEEIIESYRMMDIYSDSSRIVNTLKNKASNTVNSMTGSGNLYFKRDSISVINYESRSKFFNRFHYMRCNFVSDSCVIESGIVDSGMESIYREYELEIAFGGARGMGMKPVTHTVGLLMNTGELNYITFEGPNKTMSKSVRKYNEENRSFIEFEYSTSIEVEVNKYTCKGCEGTEIIEGNYIYKYDIDQKLIIEYELYLASPRTESTTRVRLYPYKVEF